MALMEQYFEIDGWPCGMRLLQCVGAWPGLAPPRRLRTFETYDRQAESCPRLSPMRMSRQCVNEVTATDECEVLLQVACELAQDIHA